MGSARPRGGRFLSACSVQQERVGARAALFAGESVSIYAADDGNNTNHRMFVAQSDLTGPTFSFSAKGKIYDPSTDRWAIDGTVLEATNGSLYFIWSGWPGAQDGLQNLYIAPMKDPLHDQRTSHPARHPDPHLGKLD